MSCVGDDGKGKIYQVDSNGRTLGIVHIPSPPAGLALHRTHGLVLALPSEGGTLIRVDDTGKIGTIMSKNLSLPHPTKVAIAGDSDTIVIADESARSLMATNVAGLPPKLYRKLDGSETEHPDMSVAVTTDRCVLYGTSGGGKAGVFRFEPGSRIVSPEPFLPQAGGVAADPATPMWAATQSGSQIVVYEGDQLVKKCQLPPGKRAYRNGLLSFGPAGSVVVAARAADEAMGNIWLIQYQTTNDGVRHLFRWEGEQIVDFVVGPRMPWDRHSPTTFKSRY